MVSRWYLNRGITTAIGRLSTGYSGDEDATTEIRRDWKRQEVEIGTGIIWSTTISNESKSADMENHARDGIMSDSKMSRIRSESLRLIRNYRLKSVKLAFKLNAIDHVRCIVSLPASKSEYYIAALFCKKVFSFREDGRGDESGER